jgi:hypothetical protein
MQSTVSRDALHFHDEAEEIARRQYISFNDLAWNNAAQECEGVWIGGEETERKGGESCKIRKEEKIYVLSVYRVMYHKHKRMGNIAQFYLPSPMLGTKF